jgi:2-dehydro-3-deoxyphosphogluconate aldolase/(4S)-4-hydroxy-2-oxoglutarate aldolase
MNNMARFSRIEVSLKIMETGLVPLFYNADTGVCKKVVDACYRGGARVFEFTNRGDFAHEIFSEIKKYVTEKYPDFILGIGSVIDAGTASVYMQLGAGFIVSPVLVEEMAPVCNRRKVLWIPGCGTLSEISKAESLGAEIVKIFPGSSVGGPDFLKAVKGPMPWTSIMATGGVDTSEESLKAWFEAGVTAVGMGSKLITKEILKNNDYELLENKVRQVLDIIQRSKNGT